MNKEKLIDIILKDIGELKEISEEIKKTGINTKLETDIAFSKANLILQEFQLLKEKYSENITATTMEETDIVATGKMIIGKAEKKIEEPIATFQREEQDEEMADVPQKIANDPDDPEEDYPENEDFEKNDDGNETVEDTENDDEDDFEEEEEERTSISHIEKKTVGENFHIKKSLNDMLEKNNTLDQKIAHSPIANLQSAIGINDRFLFIREMFNNDAALYSEAVRQIDQCENIKQAVNYLSSNFKIKKTETSLKFVEQIRRRFAK